jgi:hypothetical protein
LPRSAERSWWRIPQRARRALEEPERFAKELIAFVQGVRAARCQLTSAEIRPERIQPTRRCVVGATTESADPRARQVNARPLGRALEERDRGVRASLQARLPRRNA